MKKGVKADVIVVIPRKGCDEALLETMVKMQPKRIVCILRPQALARDLKILSEKGYKVDEAPVDIMGHSVHVECVTLMSRVEK